MHKNEYLTTLSKETDVTEYSVAVRHFEFRQAMGHLTAIACVLVLGVYIPISMTLCLAVGCRACQ